MRPAAVLAAAVLALSLPVLAPAEPKAVLVERMKIGGLSKEDDAAGEQYFTNTELIDQEDARIASTRTCSGIERC